MNAATAFRHCEAVTRRRARNFYYGIRLLPPAKRAALCAVYAFARRVDDVGDGVLDPGAKLERLHELRERVGSLRQESPDPVLSALGHAALRFPLPLEAFGDLLDGVEMDARDTTYGTFDDLVVYCRRVAGSIGRLSVSIFGSPDPDRAARLGDDLGVAMQLTNVLRDVREDLGLGRMYLPREDLERFGCVPDPIHAPPSALAALVLFEAARAREWFGRGLRLLGLLDARSAACVSAMTGIYRRILDRLDREPVRVARDRVSLPGWEKAWVAARSIVGAGA